MSKNGLGKGFDGLIPTGLDVNNIAKPGDQVKQLLIIDIIANPYQPRKSFDETSLNELAISIKEHGIIQPIVVTPSKDGKYRIIAGERRYRAAQIANLVRLPALIRNHKELEELEIALVENVQRVDLSPIETAVSIVRLRDQFSLSTKQIATKLGKAETTISNIVRLLQLPKEAIDSLQKNDISEGHARAILALKTDEKAQKDLLNKIIVQKLTVRDAEEYVKHMKKSSLTKPRSAFVDSILKELDKKLAAVVTIKEKRNDKGSLIINYSSEEELKKYLNKLNR